MVLATSRAGSSSRGAQPCPPRVKWVGFGAGLGFGGRVGVQGLDLGCRVWIWGQSLGLGSGFGFGVQSFLLGAGFGFGVQGLDLGSGFGFGVQEADTDCHSTM